MTTQTSDLSSLSRRPRRADAQRNYDRLLAAARAAFTETDADTSLEEIARRAGVGIGTLYRHFPTRQALIESVYVDGVEALSRSADDLAAELPPWEALTAWLRRFVDYTATKRALASQLFAESGSSQVLPSCRMALFAAGESLVQRAQEAGAVRPDVNVGDVLHLVNAITLVNAPEPGQIDRLFEVALDGLRHRPD